MKADTLQILSLAKTIYDEAKRECIADNKYVASAGLIRLQDYIELVFYGIMIELGIDNTANIESIKFEEMISKIKSFDPKYVIKKSGTLKALNKQRILIKHYGQLAEPETVHGYLDAATLSIDALTTSVFGKPIQLILIYDLIENNEIRAHLEASRQYYDKGEYYKSLIETRKAVYILIEEDYSIEGWKDKSSSSPPEGLLGSPARGGYSAPYYSKNKEYVDKYVKDPFDYIVLDHDKVRMHLLEWGVPTEYFWNIWRLTPSVFRFRESKKWYEKIDTNIMNCCDNQRNASICLDQALSLSVGRQNHTRSNILLNYDHNSSVKCKIIADSNIYEKADPTSKIIGRLETGIECDASYGSVGLDETGIYIRILYINNDKKIYYFGYVPSNALEIGNRSPVI